MLKTLFQIITRGSAYYWYHDQKVIAVFIPLAIHIGVFLIYNDFSSIYIASIISCVLGTTIVILIAFIYYFYLSDLFIPNILQSPIDSFFIEELFIVVMLVSTTQTMLYFMSNIAQDTPDKAGQSE
jgi:hypothetical protein